MTYKILFVVGSGTVQTARPHAPPESYLCAMGRKKGASFAIRYWPSKKGWRILDLRATRNVRTHKGNTFWVGQEQHTRGYPNEDAAVMHAMAILNSQPKLL